MSKRPASPRDPAVVEAEVAQIAKMNKAELKQLWRAMHKDEPPKAFGPDLLRRSLAYQVQERAFGGLSAATKRLLAAVVEQIRKRPSSRIEMPRRFKSGAVLIREWKSKIHRVTVVEGGFLYGGATYSNLSEIAGLITGTNWNGPRFFGLRPSAKQTAAAAKKAGSDATPKRGRGRPRKNIRSSANADASP